MGERCFPYSLSAVIAWGILVVCSEFKFINTFQKSWVTNKVPFSQKAKLLTGFKTRAGFFHLAKHTESLFPMAGRPGLKPNCRDILIFLVEFWGLSKKCRGLQHKGVFGAWSYDKCHHLLQQLVIWQNWASLVTSLLVNVAASSPLLWINHHCKKQRRIYHEFFSREFLISGCVKREALLLC